MAYRAVRQAKGLLGAADGLPNEEIGRRVGVSANTMRSWRAGFARDGVSGVGVIADGRGRKPWLPEGKVAEVVRITMNEKPDDTSTHWTTRSLARKVGISKDSVARIWRDHELKPWRTDTFKISNDPHFEEKIVDVVELYPEPTGEGGGIQLRRKDAVPGPRPHPAEPAHAPGPGRDHDP